MFLTCYGRFARIGRCYHCGLSCHLVVNDQVAYESVLSKAKKILHDDFHIEQTTIQVDKEHSQCKDHDPCN